MKKVLALFLALTLALSLFGCTETPESETEPTSEPITEPTTEDVPDPGFTIVQKPMVSISLPTQTETETDENGNVIFRYVYPTISMVHPDNAIAEAIILDTLNRIDSHQRYVNEIRGMAKEYADTPGFNPYLYTINYSPVRIDQSVLSISYSATSYAGGAHPSQSLYAANYDLTTGNVLTLGSIMHHIDSKKTLETMVTDALDAMKDEYYLYPDYTDYVSKRFQKDESFDEDWYFNDNGLCFFFSPYEIAPYASGPIIVELPYDTLVGVIADEYFPPEKVQANGVLNQVSFESADLNTFTQISELIIEPGAAKTIYYTDSIVYGVRIAQTNPDTGYPSVIFAMEALTPGDAIMVEGSAETRNTLSVTYYSGGKSVNIQH